MSPVGFVLARSVIGKPSENWPEAGVKTGAGREGEDSSPPSPPEKEFWHETPIPTKTSVTVSKTIFLINSFIITSFERDIISKKIDSLLYSLLKQFVNIQIVQNVYFVLEVPVSYKDIKVDNTTISVTVSEKGGNETPSTTTTINEIKVENNVISLESFDNISAL